MKMKNLKRISGNQEGFTLTELLVVMAIMAFVAIAIAEITLKTVTSMLMATSMNVAQGSVEQIISKMADDIRTAGANDLKHIDSGSDGTHIVFTRFGSNMDSFSGSDDTNFDKACYGFVDHTGGDDPFSTSYKEGYLEGGTGSGGNAVPACPNMYRLTDQLSDVREFKIQYCSPSGGGASYGAFNCTTTAIDNSGIDASVPDYVGSAACVFMVKLSVTYSRKYTKNGNAIDPNFYEDAVYTYQTAVSPRNIITNAAHLNINNNNIQDCCEAPYGTDATCKPASGS